MTRFAALIKKAEHRMYQGAARYDLSTHLGTQASPVSEAGQDQMTLHGDISSNKGHTGSNKSRLWKKSENSRSYKGIKPKTSAQLSSALPQALFQTSRKGPEVQGASESPAERMSPVGDLLGHVNALVLESDKEDENISSTQNLLRALSRYRPMGLAER
jgi:hypothetical protein